jgi:hypothetical protein
VLAVGAKAQWRRESDGRGIDKRVECGGDKLGEALVSEGRIPPEQLEEALAIQRKGGGELGEVLRSLGHASKADLAKALAKRLRLEYVEMTEKDVERRAASLVDRRILRKHGVLPLRVEDHRRA